jgi:hypothetical protein
MVLAHAVAGHATDITTCGTTVAAGDTGVLQADLDCPTEPWFGVRLLSRSTLRLNGHSIKVGAGTFAGVLGVARVDDEEPDEGGPGRFTLEGPGEISGPGPDPMFLDTTEACVTLQDGRATITSPTGVIDIHGCNFGIVGYILEYNNSRAKASVDHVIVHDNSLEGITVRKLVASSVTSYGNGGAGVHGIATLIANDVVAYDNHSQGVFATRSVRGDNVTVTGNGSGVESFRRVKLSHLTATGNTYSYGVRAPRVTLLDSVVTGNALYDVAATSLPRLSNTTCDTSLNTATSTPWGVCAND